MKYGKSGYLGGKRKNMILFRFAIPVSVQILIIRSRDNYNFCFHSLVSFFLFLQKEYRVCDRVQLIVSYIMNLSIYISDSSLSEFLRKTLQCIPNETF